MAKKILSADETQKTKFKYVTGVCPNCGGNKFHFDPKEQTFVCEFCSTEVYSAQEEQEKVEEPIEEIKEEEKVEEPEDDDDMGSGIVSLFRQMICAFIIFVMPAIIRSFGLLEIADANSSQALTIHTIEMMLHAMSIIGFMLMIASLYKVAKAMLWNTCLTENEEICKMRRKYGLPCSGCPYSDTCKKYNR